VWLRFSCADKADRDWLPWQRPVMDRKTNFTLIIIAIVRSTNPGNLAQIGPVDVEIIGLTEIVKIRNSGRTYGRLGRRHVYGFSVRLSMRILVHGHTYDYARFRKI